MPDIRDILNSSIMAREKLDYKIDAKNIVKQWLELLEKNKDSILKINDIDIKNNNGFKLSFDIINNMKNNLIIIDDQYRKVITMQKDEVNNYIIGKEQDNVGTILLAYQNNSYTMIEFIAKSILTHNSLIISSTNEFMRFTNVVILDLLFDVLKAYKCDVNLVQMCYLQDYSDILFNDVSINKVFACGNLDFNRMIMNKSKIPVQCIAYDNYEMYVEDNTNIDLVEKIVEKFPDITVYTKEGISLGDIDTINVEDIDEAIYRINASGAKYSCSIFTNSGENGSKFLRETKSTYIGVNSSPVKEFYNDVDISLFVTLKNMYYPNPLRVIS